MFNEEASEPINLFHLSWEDILYSHFLPYLNWSDLFNLRRVCWQGKELVDTYFAKSKSINLTNPTNFNSIAFHTVTRNCTKLRFLRLTESNWIKDGQLSPVFARNTSLTHLDLTACASLNGTCLLTLAVKCKKLKSLILRECNWVSRGAVETLMSHLNSLEEVDLSSCSVLSNQLILNFIQKFPKLKKIGLAHIQSVNDSTLVSIGRGCCGLTLLDIRACMGVTDNGIRSIAEYCPKLTSLSVARCHLVTENSLRLLRDREGLTIDRQTALVPYQLRVQV